MLVGGLNMGLVVLLWRLGDAFTQKWKLKKDDIEKSVQVDNNIAVFSLDLIVIVFVINNDFIRKKVCDLTSLLNVEKIRCRGVRF